MKNSFYNKCAVLAVSLLMGSGVTFAHSPGEVGTATEGHLRDANNHPVKNTSGECWHLGATTPAKDCTVQPPPPPPPAPTPEPPAPAPKPVPQPVKQKVVLQADALFDFDKAVLKPEGKSSIDEAVVKLPKEQREAVKVTGHTDSIGADAYNLKLGQRRADAVKAYLVEKGVAPEKITTESKGESQPVASNKTKEGRAKNRRVELEIDGYEMVMPKQ